MAYTGHDHQVCFTCVTRNSSILEWSSTEYIESNIQIYNSTLGTDVLRGTAHAVLISITVKYGVLEIESELCIQISASTQYSTATVQCSNNDQGTDESITFNITGMIIFLGIKYSDVPRSFQCSTCTVTS